MRTLTQALKATALATTVAAGGVLGGLLLYRRMTQFHFDFSGGPFVDPGPMVTAESVLFFVGFTLAVTLVGWGTVARLMTVADESVAYRDTRRAQTRFRALVTASLARSLVLTVAGAALGVGCQIALDEALTSGYTPPAQTYAAQGA